MKRLFISLIIAVLLTSCYNKSEAGYYMYNAETSGGTEYDAVSDKPIKTGETMGMDAYGFLRPKDHGVCNVVIKSKRYF